MKQQSTLQNSAAAPATRTRASVVMGQGVITPAVREHLAKAQRSAAKQQTPAGR